VELKQGAAVRAAKTSLLQFADPVASLVVVCGLVIDLDPMGS